MAKGKKPGDDYEIGYGKPPRDTRFKPGQSGNPNGRPRLTSDLAALLQKAGAEEITVSEGGSKMVVPKLEAVSKTLIARAMKGDVAAAKLIAAILEKGARDVAETAESYELSEADVEVMEQHAEWLKIVEAVKNRGSDDEGS